MCQIRRHNNLASCWIVASGFVYDASDFIQSHPGGIKSILRYAGGQKDTMEDMAFHTAHARKLWKDMRIGKVRKCGQIEDKEAGQCTVS